MFLVSPLTIGSDAGKPVFIQPQESWRAGTVPRSFRFSELERPTDRKTNLRREHLCLELRASC
jgi:hypothetical protein